MKEDVCIAGGSDDDVIVRPESADEPVKILIEIAGEPEFLRILPDVCGRQEFKRGQRRGVEIVISFTIVIDEAGDAGQFRAAKVEYAAKRRADLFGVVKLPIRPVACVRVAVRIAVAEKSVQVGSISFSAMAAHAQLGGFV